MMLWYQNGKDQSCQIVSILGSCTAVEMCQYHGFKPLEGRSQVRIQRFYQAWCQLVRQVMSRVGNPIKADEFMFHAILVVQNGGKLTNSFHWSEQHERRIETLTLFGCHGLIKAGKVLRELIEDSYWYLMEGVTCCCKSYVADALWAFDVGGNIEPWEAMCSAFGRKYLISGGACC